MKIVFIVTLLSVHISLTDHFPLHSLTHVTTPRALSGEPTGASQI